MHNMQKIYKRGILESRIALALVVATTLATTFAVPLVLLGMRADWPFAILVAASAGTAYGRLSRPYEISAGAGRIMALLSLNALILLTCILLF